MKQIAVIFAIALIGLAGVAVKNHDTLSGQLMASSQTQPPGASPSVAASSSTEASATNYKDGTFKGDAEETPYGTVQIAIVIAGGKITTVNLLQMPDDRGHTQEVTAVAGPLLKQTTIDKQSAHIDFVSGATSTSEGYQLSLQSALDQARI